MPRNVVQKWGFLLKIIDFRSSNTDHICPGLNQCSELKVAWRALLLDRAASRFQSWVPRILVVAAMILIRIVMRGFILLSYLYS